MSQLKYLKKLYDILGNDQIRATCLAISEKFSVKKDIIRMDTNDLCNIECIMCSHKLKSRKIDNVMNFGNYTKIIDFFVKTTRMLYLSCGHEPLMTPYFEKYIAYAKMKGIPVVSLCTNGMLLNDKIIKCLVEEKIDEIIISLNGFNKDDYNRIMRKSNYDVVIKNVKKLADYKKMQNSQYPRIRINSILMKSNIQNFDSLIDLVHKYDIDTIQFREFNVYDNQNNIEEAKKELISNINSNELNEVLKKIKNSIGELKKEGKELIIPKSLFGKDVIDRKIASNKKTCSIPYFSYWIEHDGMIKVCVYDNNAYIGNFFKDNLKTIKKNRDIYRKQALHGICNASKCAQNIDSSNVI